VYGADRDRGPDVVRDANAALVTKIIEEDSVDLLRMLDVFLELS